LHKLFNQKTTNPTKLKKISQKNTLIFLTPFPPPHPLYLSTSLDILQMSTKQLTLVALIASIALSAAAESSPTLSKLKSHFKAAPPAWVIPKRHTLPIFWEEDESVQHQDKNNGRFFTQKEAQIFEEIACFDPNDEPCASMRRSYNNCLAERKKNPNRLCLMLMEEEEWEVNAGISGSGGKPQWSVGVSHKWDEDNEGEAEEEQNLAQGMRLGDRKSMKPFRPIIWEEEVLEVNAGISGGQGKPQWNVGVSHKWDEDNEELSNTKQSIVRKIRKLAMAE
jgi:hypothetical protein